MKKFIGLFIAILISMECFAFFGGGIIFDFSSNAYLAGFAWAIVITFVSYIFILQQRQINQLIKNIDIKEEK